MVVYRTAFWPKKFVFGLLLLAGVFQNCDRDDEEPTVTYHCLPENFTNDCDAYQGIEKSLGYGHIGFEAAAPTFVPGNSDEIIFTYDNNEDKLEPSKIIRYNWRTKEKTVLIEESPMIYAYNITLGGWVCAEVSSGPIVYFHLDSPSTTMKEIPFGKEIVKTPAWLSDGETIVYMADSHDLDFKLYSYNIKSGVKQKHNILANNISNLLTSSISKTDHFVVSVLRAS